MRILLIVVLIGWLQLQLSACSWVSSRADADVARPNILLIVVDDLGYSDLGAFGGEIETPTLDLFAREGIRFTSAYAAATCSPTRAMLMTGADHHLVGLGAMAEMILPAQRGKPGYEGELNNKAITIATRLRDGGYRTLMAGKWHLGTKPQTSPHAHGFEHSYALLEGGASHFSNDGLFPFQKKVHYQENGMAVEWPHGQYSSDVYTQKMIEYINHVKNEGRPFFGLLSLTAPHWPLQAPDNLIDTYRGRYDAGWDQLRNRRVAGLQKEGMISAGRQTKTPPGYRSWDSLSDIEKRSASREMEIFAAMVDGVDRNISRLKGFLEQNALLDNTVVIFMSDNGAEGVELETNSMMEAFLSDNFDNSFPNLGREHSYVMYGPGWAHASSAPSRLFKGHLAEGGVKVPAFIWRKGLHSKGAIVSAPVTVRDIARTVVDLAAIDAEGDYYSGKLIAPMSGKSLLPLLTDPNATIHGDEGVVAAELYGRRSLRKANWKILWEVPPYGKGRWELFDLAKDPSEAEDLAERHPALVESLVQDWMQYADESGVVEIKEGLNW
ncbi:arylsulfatase [Pseudomaricurvus alkylphenolicus]|uniref:arylsulfatase n=1 Tax=Pseudomaricurvus alkylphenolicus TaxID=1306991 RepID=UPI0014222A1C|nr:arylsulfatase [Pseudomaricurvus alkylphenolicus]NIB38717.1 arylsulfatase [Pseudomaricurvus alkylphenolicus]